MVRRTVSSVQFSFVRHEGVGGTAGSYEGVGGTAGWYEGWYEGPSVQFSSVSYVRPLPDLERAVDGRGGVVRRLQRCLRLWFAQLAVHPHGDLPRMIIIISWGGDRERPGGEGNAAGEGRGAVRKTATAKPSRLQ